MHWRCLNRVIDLTRPVVMGILNVTPDSFSDGDRYSHPGAALDRAAAMLSEGAAIIDVGGESTRPGSAGVDAAVEIDRVLPVIERIARTLDIAISIDTSKPEVMAAATAAGACIVNDVYALRAPGARDWAAQAGVGLCLMHMQGEPRTMQHDPRYHDVVAEVCAFLLRERRVVSRGRRRRGCHRAGSRGVGFGKGLEHNMTLLKELPRLVAAWARRWWWACRARASSGGCWVVTSRSDCTAASASRPWPSRRARAWCAPMTWRPRVTPSPW